MTTANYLIRIYVDNAINVNPATNISYIGPAGLGFSTSASPAANALQSSLTSVTTGYNQYVVYGSLTGYTYTEVALNQMNMTGNALISKLLWSVTETASVVSFNSSTQLRCVVGSAPQLTPLVSNVYDPSGYTQVGIIYNAQSIAVNLTTVAAGSSSTIFQPLVRPAFGVCVAALATLDLTSMTSHGAVYFETMNIVNVSGYRNLLTADGVAHIARLQGQSSLFGGVISQLNYASLSPLYPGTNYQSTLTLPFADPLYTVSGRSTTYSATYVRQGFQLQGLYPWVEEVGFSQVGSPWFNVDTAPLLSVVLLNGAWNPQQYCPLDGSILPLATGLTSPVTLPATSTVTFAYLILPNQFQPGNEWAVCASGTLTLASGTTNGLGTSFSVVGASGTRAFLDLTKFTANVSTITGVAAPSSVLGFAPDNQVLLTRPFLSPNGLALTLNSAPRFRLRLAVVPDAGAGRAAVVPRPAYHALCAVQLY